jgi:hypothetical protein
MKKLIAALFLVSTVVYAGPAPIKPDPKLTPGAINPAATKAVICVRGYTAQPGIRNVPEKLKKQVFAEYGIDPKSDQYEIDHLLSLQLGGSNDIHNLWPQSYTTKPLNAHVKDGLENTLHAAICNGKVDLATVQKEVATDWTAAYAKYVGPLPK